MLVIQRLHRYRDFGGTDFAERRSLRGQRDALAQTKLARRASEVCLRKVPLGERSSRPSFQIALELASCFSGFEFQRDENVPWPIPRGVFVLSGDVPFEPRANV